MSDSEELQSEKEEMQEASDAEEIATDEGIEEASDDEPETTKIADDETTAPEPPQQKRKIFPKKICHKTIYVQFPCKLPETAKVALEDCHAGIVMARLPRQKKARFCFVDCKSETDAVQVEKFLRTTKICGHKVFANRNRKIDDPKYKRKLIEKSVERRTAKAEAKRMKRDLKRKQTQQSESTRVNKIVVTNIPETADETTVKQLFPKAVEFAYRQQPKRVAFVTFTSAQEATKFIRKKPSIAETELAVRAAIHVTPAWKRTKEPKEAAVVDTKDEEPARKKTKKDPKVSPKPKTKKKKKTQKNFVAVKKNLI